jgi:lipopolysaccharide export system protein LptA
MIKDSMTINSCIASLNKDLKELEEVVEENEIKEIEKKHRKYLNREQRGRHMKTKYDLYKCLCALMERGRLFEEA